MYKYYRKNGLCLDTRVFFLVIAEKREQKVFVLQMLHLL